MGSVDRHQRKMDDRLHHDMVANAIYDRTAGPAWDEAYREVTIEAWIPHLDKNDSRFILEYGCGTGNAVLKLAGAGYRVIGFDHSREMVEKTRAKVRELGHDNVFYVVGDGECLPFKSAAFDAITCRWVLHHIPDVEKAIFEMCRVLAKNGRIFVAEISSKVNLIERIEKACVGGGAVLFHKITRDKFNRLKAYETIVRTHERAIDPGVVLDRLESQGVECAVLYIPHIPVLYYYLPTEMSLALVRTMRQLALLVDCRKATVFILEGRKHDG